MIIEQFAMKHRLKVQRSKHDGTEIISGKLGNLYEYSDFLLGLCFTPPGEPRAKKRGSVRRAAIAADMTVRQNGDSEGCLSFDPNNREQARLAIKAMGARPKRRRTPEQIAKFLVATQAQLALSEGFAERHMLGSIVCLSRRVHRRARRKLPSPTRGKDSGSSNR